MHNIQFRLLPFEASLSLSLSPPPSPLFLSHNALRLDPTSQPRRAFGDTRANSNFPQSDFFQSTPLEGLSYLDLVRAFLESIFSSPSPLSLFFFLSFCLSPFSLTGDLSIPSRSIFLCLESNKVSDFRWRIQLISLGMRRVPQRTRRAAISAGIPRNDISCWEFFPEVSSGRSREAVDVSEYNTRRYAIAYKYECSVLFDQFSIDFMFKCL